jgi:hypothetical protein
VYWQLADHVRCAQGELFWCRGGTL